MEIKFEKEIANALYSAAEMRHFVSCIEIENRTILDTHLAIINCITILEALLVKLDHQTKNPEYWSRPKD